MMEFLLKWVMVPGNKKIKQSGNKKFEKYRICVIKTYSALDKMKK